MRASQLQDRVSMAITIRPLLPVDLPPLSPLFGAYLDFYGVPRAPETENNFLAQRLGADDSTCLGAFAGGELAGFALCHHTHNSLRLAPGMDSSRLVCLTRPPAPWGGRIPPRRGPYARQSGRGL